MINQATEGSRIAPLVAARDAQLLGCSGRLGRIADEADVDDRRVEAGEPVRHDLR